eukprot:1943869-Rhodomonas_salina.1
MRVGQREHADQCRAETATASSLWQTWRVHPLPTSDTGSDLQQPAVERPRTSSRCARACVYAGALPPEIKDTPRTRIPGTHIVLKLRILALDFGADPRRAGESGVRVLPAAVRDPQEPEPAQRLRLHGAEGSRPAPHQVRARGR